MGSLDIDMAEVVRERAQAAYQSRLAKHPDPCDPEWPGHAREAEMERLLDETRDLAALARDYLDRAIKAKNTNDPDALRRMLSAAQDELEAAFDSLERAM